MPRAAADDAMWIRLVWLALCLATGPISAVHYVAPEDCKWATLDRGSKGDVSLTCNLRTVNGAFDHTNFSLIQPEHTVRLAVRCDDVLFESSLPNNSFEHLRELRALSLDGCKLRSLPALAFAGLGRLRNLTLRTRNRDWGEMALELPPGSLRPLRRLERLDLSRNNIQALPRALLCDLPDLRQVNLSHNSLADLPSLRWSEEGSCNPACHRMELAYNRIRVLVDRGFMALTHLQTLNLRRNLISRAEEHALTGLSQLQLLDISGNQLVALPPQFFQPVVARLSELYLQNNSVSVLPPGLFAKLQQLLILDLSNNEITAHWLGADVFADLIRLVMLDLSYNRLSQIDASTFRSQYSLQILQLHHNEIATVADNAFASLYNLHTLVLSHNRLRIISPLTLNGLFVLSSLSMDSNELENVHPEAFRNNSNLMELTMSANKLRNIPVAIRTLQVLRSFDVGENELTDIQNASYQGLFQLYSLRLQGNYIGNVTKGAFQDMPSLRILNVARNRIHAIEQGTFDDVPELHALRLDSNFLSDINGLFSNLHDLLMLNISANKIGWFDYALIPIGLQWLDIHDNSVESLGNYFELDSALKLRTLDASFNRISEIDSSTLPNGIEIVFLHNNHIRSINPFTFMGKQNLTRVDLTNNRLSSLEINAFRLTEVPTRRPLPKFSLSGNPYMCDCNMEWLQRLASLDESRQYPKMIDVEKVMCQLSFTREKATVPLVRAKASQFLCRYKSHCFALCHCCEFDACDCEMVCPENCGCFYDQSWNTNIVDCSARNHSVVPGRIPMDVTELYLDGNDIPSLSSHAFIGRKNLKVLHLNGSRVRTINNRTFNGLKSLEILRLENNQLTTLHGYEFERLLNLRELYLSHNGLSTVNNATFLPLRSLDVLHLDNNRVAHFQVWTLNPRLLEVSVAKNPWSCECRFARDFSEWLASRGESVVDAYSVRCFYNETAGMALLEINVTSCANDSGDAGANGIVQKFYVRDFVPLLVVLAALFVLVVLAMALVFAYRREMSVWIFSKYGVRLLAGREGGRRRKAEEDKLFDAFVSYSKKDEAFVAELLAPELECGNPSYRLCLHYRDLPAVGGYMSDAIVEAMESSRRTVVILSENFLKSEWCRYEFKSAHHEVQRTCKHKLIFVVLGRVEPRDLDPDIRLWLKTNTFLHWGEKMFWEKLRYAMPDGRSCRKGDRTRQDVAVHM